jgi:hypothetical protein
MQGTFREKLEKNKKQNKKNREHSGNIRGTFREHSV